MRENESFEYGISNDIIQGILEQKSGNYIRWISPSDHEEWLGIGVADHFSNAKDAIAKMKQLTSGAPEFRGRIRCFVALPFDMNLWGQNKNWVLPKWILKKKSDNWTGVEIISSKIQNADMLPQISNLKQLRIIYF